MNDKLNICDIQEIINNILNNMELFRKCNLEKVAYSELFKLHKQAIYILEQMSVHTK